MAVSNLRKKSFSSAGMQFKFLAYSNIVLLMETQKDNAYL